MGRGQRERGRKISASRSDGDTDCQSAIITFRAVPVSVCLIVWSFIKYLDMESTVFCKGGGADDLLDPATITNWIG